MEDFGGDHGGKAYAGKGEPEDSFPKSPLIVCEVATELKASGSALGPAVVRQRGSNGTDWSGICRTHGEKLLSQWPQKDPAQ